MTTFEQEATLFHLLSLSMLKGAISGGIYKLSRPVDSILEDVVINSLPMGDGSRDPGEGTIQFGTSNVNIYVPDTPIRVAGKEQLLPNTVRMGALAAIAIPVIESFTVGKVGSTQYRMWIANQGVYQEPEIRQHYINLRVEFQYFLT